MGLRSVPIAATRQGPSWNEIQQDTVERELFLDSLARERAFITPDWTDDGGRGTADRSSRSARIEGGAGGVGLCGPHRLI